MTPEERARKCYHDLWVDNGTHSEEFVIAGIARAIRDATNDYTALEQAARPFAHPDLMRVLVGNVNGDDSVIFVRGEATITLGDVRKLAALLAAEDVER
jgi:hypothetical protein